MLRHLGFVIFPDFQLLDATGPAGVFDVANRMAGEEVYKITMLSERGGLVTSSCGVGVDSQPLSACRQADTVLVVGGLGTAAAAKNSAIKKYVNEMAEQAQRLCSVCTGTFVLAAAGVLSGRKATTHWRQTAYLLRNYPEVCVQEDKIWVRDGKFWSSAGVTAGIDLALALVKEDLGEDVAKNTAREIVVYYQRPGGQSQFSTIEELGGGDDRFKPLLAWIRENIARPIKVEHLAEVVAMSPRNFSRRFSQSIGRTPAKAVEHIRVEEAKHLVESSELSLEQIAQRCGFADSELMRRAFVRMFGQSPRAIRTHTHINQL